MKRPLVAKVKIAAKQLGLADDVYRAVLQRVTGKRSAADCTDAELVGVVKAFEAKGWRASPPASAGRAGRTTRPADHAAAKKARALWISLAQLGEVQDPSEAALEAFAARQLKVERLQWADQGQCYKLIEALKGWAERAGWPQSATSLHDLKAGLSAALKKRLTDLGGDPRAVAWGESFEERCANLGAAICEAKARNETAAEAGAVPTRSAG